MTVEAGFALSVILALCGVAFRLGALSQKVDGISDRTRILETGSTSEGAKLTKVASDVRLIMQQLNDISRDLRRGKVWNFDERGDA